MNQACAETESSRKEALLCLYINPPSKIKSIPLNRELVRCYNDPWRSGFRKVRAPKTLGRGDTFFLTVFHPHKGALKVMECLYDASTKRLRDAIEL